MLSIPTGTDATIPVTFADPQGQPFTVTAATYKLLDEDGALLASGDVALGTDGTTGTVSTLAANNTLAVGVQLVLRVVQITATKADNNQTFLQTHYTVQSADVLATGINSFQTMFQALALEPQVVDLDAWKRASEGQRVAAMIQARDNICRLRFDFSRVDEYDWFNRLSFANLFVPTDLSYLTPEQLLGLEPKFLRKLRLAQLVEANEILAGPDSTEAKRREGLTLDTIGNVKQMFRSSKPLDLPCSRRALDYLAGYVSFSLRVGR